MNRNETIDRFRKRLRELIDRSTLSRTAFASTVGIDRSTLSQILSSDSDRLPRVETLLAVADQANVSVDWLVGRTEEGPMAAAVLEVEPGANSPADERLARWRAEAAGYKIRYVPASLPDLLRTDAVIEFEYKEAVLATPEQKQQNREDGLAYQRRPETDTEVCCAMQVVEAFAYGEHVWRGLSKRARARQLALMADLCEELYPTFRWFLYDGLRSFCAPMTIFGAKRAALYTGQSYLVFNGAEHIRLFTAQFDSLIRAAVVEPPHIPAYLRDLRNEMA